MKLRKILSIYLSYFPYGMELYIKSLSKSLHPLLRIRKYSIFLQKKQTFNFSKNQYVNTCLLDEIFDKNWSNCLSNN